MGTWLGMLLLGHTQEAAAAARVVFRQDLPPLRLDPAEVTVTEVSYAPGASSAKHRHPGIIVGYVLEGEVRFQVEGGGPEKICAAGQFFYEPPEHIHLVSANASDSKPAKLLAFMVAEKGRPAATPA